MTFIIRLVRSFRWEEFILPSTLKLAPLIRLLLVPTRSKEASERIELGLHEALVNSVIHGNAGDFTKSLRVRRIITPNWFVWQIQDEGFGIPKSERISTLPNKLEAESGRGLFLIHQCFDDVRWSKAGNRLQVASRRS